MENNETVVCYFGPQVGEDLEERDPETQNQKGIKQKTEEISVRKV